MQLFFGNDRHTVLARFHRDVLRAEILTKRQSVRPFLRFLLLALFANYLQRTSK